MSKLHLQAVDAAQAAIDVNTKRLRMETGHPPAIDFFHLLVSLIEWCDAHSIDFDASVFEVRRHFLEAEGREIGEGRADG